jgi:stress-induced morphogen
MCFKTAYLSTLDLLCGLVVRVQEGGGSALDHDSKGQRKVDRKNKRFKVTVKSHKLQGIRTRNQYRTNSRGLAHPMNTTKALALRGCNRAN